MTTVFVEQPKALPGSAKNGYVWEMFQKKGGGVLISKSPDILNISNDSIS